MGGIPEEDFQKEINFIYKEEQYSLRDNGAVWRHPRIGKRPRQNDNQWTFGKPNDKNGYLEIASVPIHRIIATAFHGEPPTSQHVVDHVDTNKRNNRPENLRWVTKLENILLNPITARRIAIVCGSVEAFLANPSAFKNSFQEPNFKWMGTVSAQEARTSYERLLAWAGGGQLPSGGSLDRWIFNRAEWLKQSIEATPGTAHLVMAKHGNAAQRNWKRPSEFPCCPQDYPGEPIAAYAEALTAGAEFCRNDIYTSLVVKSAVSADLHSLYVLTESADKKAVKPWALAVITFENDLFVHTNIGNFFKQEGAEKRFCLLQGIQWTGSDTIDDYL